MSNRTFSMTVFYVLPVDSDGDGSTPATTDQLQQCKYYVYDEDKRRYQHWDSVLLKASKSGDAIDFVALQQLLHTATVYPKPTGAPTLNATLLSATVKTFSAPNGVEQLPSVFLATVADDGCGPLVMIPVAKKATRGVILVFSVPNPNPLSAGKMLLRSTSDPEILGSTN